MNGMMDGMMGGGPMMWGMGLIWLLIIVLLVLGVGALVKYLFFNNRR
jgi:flagellar basal body-associated protein FliL